MSVDAAFLSDDVARNMQRQHLAGAPLPNRCIRAYHLLGLTRLQCWNDRNLGWRRSDAAVGSLAGMGLLRALATIATI